MAAKKRSKAKPAKPASRPGIIASPVLSCAWRSVLNMTAVAVTSGTVLLVLFAAKRLT